MTMTAAASGRFDTFSAEHFGLIAGFLVVCVALAALGRAHRGTASELRFRRGFAVLVVCFTVPMQVLQLLPGDYDVATSLPLQLCDLAWVVAVVALWTRNGAAAALVYYWGLTLTVQGIVTPALSQPFPDPRYVMFWGMHFAVVWAAVYLTFGLRVPITWRSYRFAVGCTALWAVVVMAFNAVAGTNYGYLNRKPASGSLLDLFGPWPGYVLVEVLVVCAVWALMTWPWVARGRGGQVRAARRRSRVGLLVAVLVALALGSTSCGSGGSSIATSGAQERITQGGVAALVREHVGADEVERFEVYEAEAGSVGVLVELRGAGPRDMFVVSVWSPDNELGSAGDRSCEGLEDEVSSVGAQACRVLDDGTVVQVLEGEAFSDSNTGGSTLRGSAVSPTAGAALAMYEAYGESVPLGLDTLSALLSDPLLRWTTDVAVNEAGASIDLVGAGG